MKMATEAEHSVDLDESSLVPEDQQIVDEEVDVPSGVSDVTPSENEASADDEHSVDASVEFVVDKNPSFDDGQAADMDSASNTKEPTANEDARNDGRYHVETPMSNTETSESTPIASELQETAAPQSSPTNVYGHQESSPMQISDTPNPNSPVQHADHQPRESSHHGHQPTHQSNYTVRFHSPQDMILSLPEGSRLFLGNLASERATREELASVFSKYGNIYEILIKNSYGFVQFDNPTSCQVAIQNENGRTVAGLRLDLKVSKPNNRGRGGEKSRDGPSGPRHGPTDSYTPSDGGHPRRPSEEQHRSGPARFGREDRHSRHDKKPYDRPGDAFAAGQGRSNIAQQPPRSALENAERILGRRTRDQVPIIQISAIGDINRAFLRRVHVTMQERGYRVDVIPQMPKVPLRTALVHWAREGVRFVVLLKSHHEKEEIVDIVMFTNMDGDSRDWSRLSLEASMDLIDRESDLAGIRPKGGFAPGPGPQGQPPFASFPPGPGGPPGHGGPPGPGAGPYGFPQYAPYGQQPPQQQPLLPGLDPNLIAQLAPVLPHLLQFGAQLQQQQQGQQAPGVRPPMPPAEVNALSGLLSALSGGANNSMSAPGMGHMNMPQQPPVSQPNPYGNMPYPNAPIRSPAPHMSAPQPPMTQPPSMPSAPSASGSSGNVMDLLARLNQGGRPGGPGSGPMQPGNHAHPHNHQQPPQQQQPGSQSAALANLLQNLPGFGSR